MALRALAQAHSRSDELAALGVNFDGAGRSLTMPASRFLPALQALQAAQQYMRGPEPALPISQIGIRG